MIILRDNINKVNGSINVTTNMNNVDTSIAGDVSLTSIISDENAAGNIELITTPSRKMINILKPMYQITNSGFGFSAVASNPLPLAFNHRLYITETGVIKLTCAANMLTQTVTETLYATSDINDISMPTDNELIYSIGGSVTVSAGVAPVLFRIKELHKLDNSISDCLVEINYSANIMSPNSPTTGNACSIKLTNDELATRSEWVLTKSPASRCISYIELVPDAQVIIANFRNEVDESIRNIRQLQNDLYDKVTNTYISR